MESSVDRVDRMADTQLTKVRWALGLNGALSIALGAVILIWPGISLEALVIVFGVYALATGAVSFFSAFTSGAAGERGWLIVSGLLGIAVGILVLVWPSISALALLYVIGAYAIALGIIAIGGAFWLPIDGGDTALMILGGLVSLRYKPNRPMLACVLWPMLVTIQRQRSSKRVIRGHGMRGPRVSEYR